MSGKNKGPLGKRFLGLGGSNGALDDERREKSSRESANGALNTDWHSKRYIMKLLSQQVH